MIMIENNENATCKYCKKSISMDETIDYSHFDIGNRNHLKEIVCEDCYRFSNHWRDRLEKVVYYQWEKKIEELEEEIKEKEYKRVFFSPERKARIKRLISKKKN